MRRQGRASPEPRLVRCRSFPESPCVRPASRRAARMYGGSPDPPLDAGVPPPTHGLPIDGTGGAGVRRVCTSGVVVVGASPGRPKDHASGDEDPTDNYSGRFHPAVRAAALRLRADGRLCGPFAHSNFLSSGARPLRSSRTFVSYPCVLPRPRSGSMDPGARPGRDGDSGRLLGHQLGTTRRSRSARRASCAATSRARRRPRRPASPCSLLPAEREVLMVHADLDTFQPRALSAATTIG